MKGTWGRRVYGTVTRTPRYTRFHLELQMDNKCTIYEVRCVSNDELNSDPRGYGKMLDYLTAKLETRLASHYQSWMRE